MNNTFLFLVIKNAQLAKKHFIFIKNTNINTIVLNFLWDNGYIFCYYIYKNKIKIHFKYLNNYSIIKKIKIISKPSRDLYFSLKQLYKLKQLKRFILFTSDGLKFIHECKYNKIGGKVLLIIN